MVTALLKASSSLHESVRGEIHNRILSGIYKPDELIPSTAMLSEEFGVSPITVKRALRDLQASGALISIAGKGTYVKKKPIKVVRKLDVFVPMFEGTTIQLLSTTRERITESTMASFDPPKEAMLCIRKLISVEGAPFMYDATYISPSVGDDIIEEFSEYLVVRALKNHDIHVVHTDLLIDAAPAGGMVEEFFGIPTGYPMLRRLYKYTTSDPTIQVFGVVQAPFDQLAVSMSIPASPLPEE